MSDFSDAINWQAAFGWLAGAFLGLLSWTAKTGVREMKADVAALKVEQRYVAGKLPIFDAAVDRLDHTADRVDEHGNALAAIAATLTAIHGQLARIETNLNRTPAR